MTLGIAGNPLACVGTCELSLNRSCSCSSCVSGHCMALLPRVFPLLLLPVVLVTVSRLATSLLTVDALLVCPLVWGTDQVSA